MTEVAKLFNQRAAYHIERGFTGPALFDKLAADPELPLTFTLDDQAAIERVKRDTLRVRRNRGAGPASIKAGNIVRTPRDVYCHWLRDRFTSPKK